MDMDDHHNNYQYGMSDLGQLLNGRPIHFQAIPQGPLPQLVSSCHRNLQPPQQSQQHRFDMMQMVGTQIGPELLPRGLHYEFPSDSTANNATPCTAVVVTVTNASTPSASCGFDGEAAAFEGDSGTGRWPRQETLTLLEIRSRLDPLFKEANQKGPLWDEVSRILSEENGYRRNGKTCREKFENLYKYYKKTKEGKAGRQDGKHYRFFRHLETLYGEACNSVSGHESHLVGTNFMFHGTHNSNNAQGNQEVYRPQKLCDSLSLSNTSEFDTYSSDDNDLSTVAAMENDSSEKRKKKKGSMSWKAKIKEFIDSQMERLIESQEAWLGKLTKILEQKEQERVLREEEWRKEEAARINREQKFWAEERAWIEARDAALMEALQNLTGKEFKGITSPEELMVTELQNHRETQNENGSETINITVKADGWQESEISRLIQLTNSMESRFERGGCSEEILWEEIAAKMACLGFDRSALTCKDKWDSISPHVMKAKGSNKKRKSSRFLGYSYQNTESLYSQGRAYCETNDRQGHETVRLQANDGSSPSNSNAGNAVNDSCFRFLMADGDDLWETYGLKLSKSENQQGLGRTSEKSKENSFPRRKEPKKRRCIADLQSLLQKEKYKVRQWPSFISFPES